MDRSPPSNLQYQVPAALRSSSAGFQLTRDDEDDNSEPEYSFDGKCLTPQRLDPYGRLPAPNAKRKVLEEPNGIQFADDEATRQPTDVTIVHIARTPPYRKSKRTTQNERFRRRQQLGGIERPSCTRRRNRLATRS